MSENENTVSEMDEIKRRLAGQGENAIISVATFNDEQGYEKPLMELRTRGFYSFRPDDIRLFYEERNDSGQKEKTEFVVTKSDVTLRRVSRDMNTAMTFEKGRCHNFLYETPEISIMFGVDTRTIDNTLGENGGDIEVVYDITAENQHVSRNRFKINVKERPRG
ncbi:MAG: DUF1934 domain-containing protein [Oscillospiraceae bacterium]|nr:DUF1934 domain-containing protein [Oscillospiraceae bacterium]MCD8191556.1 DUF1934 domain-containing protein [Oscillospiraceae bacterium]